MDRRLRRPALHLDRLGRQLDRPRQRAELVRRRVVCRRQQAIGGGQLYTSTDSGATWTARDSNRGWRSLASSDDGSKLVAGVPGRRLYTSVGGTTTTGTTGWLRGGQYDAVELQYAGNGLFVPLSYTNGSVIGIIGN